VDVAPYDAGVSRLARRTAVTLALVAALGAGCGGGGGRSGTVAQVPRERPRIDAGPEPSAGARRVTRAPTRVVAPERRPPTPRRPRPGARVTLPPRPAARTVRPAPKASPTTRPASPLPRCADAARTADRPVTPGSVVTVARVTACLVNARRAAAGLVALGIDPALDRAALGHAADMVRHRYFSHASRGGGLVADRARAAGYIPAGARWLVGENLAWARGRASSPRAVVAAWMRSPSHRANLLRPQYRELGLAVVWGLPTGGTAGATFDADFGAIGR
jgi:uncharacterized protein YkwD